MTTVAELRAIVRTQTQTDSNDLPDATIDNFLQQAYERTINAETEWPFLASSWELTQPAGSATITLPGDVSEAGIAALVDSTNYFRLNMVSQVWAEDTFRGNNVGTLGPALFSVWGDTLVLWPAISYDHDRAYTLRGYRQPLSWINVAADSPDCDARLHLPLTHYAVALAYAQQEDDVLEALYMTRWRDDVELARRNIMVPVYHRPLVGAGSIGSRWNYPGNHWMIQTPAGP